MFDDILNLFDGQDEADFDDMNDLDDIDDYDVTDVDSYDETDDYDVTTDVDDLDDIDDYDATDVDDYDDIDDYDATDVDDYDDIDDYDTTDMDDYDDVLSGGEDFDEAAEFEAFDADFYDEEDAMFEQDMAEYSGVPAYETFDPENADLGSIIGTPGEDMDEWHQQETNSSCAVASQEFVLEQLTGQEYNEADLRTIAEENGWYTLEGGTTMNNVGNLLEHMGLNVERSQNNTISDIENCLNNGGKVIVCVDSDEMWYGESDDVFGPGMDPDHALQVTGIDYSNPDEPMVIVNDSGVQNGCGAAVLLSDFVEAWQDSSCFMVEAYK